jgi:tRNA-splicing endonuclease subunit Sen2
VWVSNDKDSLILWKRGFFGKGDLSRSEPSWLARQINARKSRAAGREYLALNINALVVDKIWLLEMTSEEITAKRREERKQFKFDRAQAMAAAAVEAEAAFAEGREVPSTMSAGGIRSIPSAATWKPQRQISLIEAPSPSDDFRVEFKELPEDVEHLQLTLPEAFFLLWNLDCLTVHNPDTVPIFNTVASMIRVNFVS